MYPIEKIGEGRPSPGPDNHVPRTVGAGNNPAEHHQHTDKGRAFKKHDRYQSALFDRIIKSKGGSNPIYVCPDPSFNCVVYTSMQYRKFKKPENKWAITKSIQFVNACKVLFDAE